MSRNVFGWSLPPGVSNRDIEAAMGGDEACLCCFLPVESCICPECPVCGQCGDPKCYKEVGGHGIQLSQPQLHQRSEAKIVQLLEDIQDERMYQLWLKDHPEATAYLEEI